MRVLIAATPLTGHLNPLLAIGHTLMNEGCKVLGLSANIMRARFERLGAPFRAFPGRADVDLSDRDVAFPEWKTIPPGPGRLRFALEHVYIDAIHAQHQGLQRVLEEFPADVILGDNFLFGVLPMLLGRHAKRPASSYAAQCSCIAGVTTALPISPACLLRAALLSVRDTLPSPKSMTDSSMTR